MGHGFRVHENKFPDAGRFFGPTGEDEMHVCAVCTNHPLESGFQPEPLAEGKIPSRYRYEDALIQSYK
jgi:hypothetical protein